MDLEHWCLWFKRRGAGRLRHVLMRDWDPIGVAGAPSARDEYDSYIGPVAERLREGRAIDEVADFLGYARTVRMGLPRDPRADARAAGAALAWYLAEMDRVAG